MVLVQAADVFRERAARPSEWRVEVVTTFHDFLALQSSWNALVDRAGIEHPFLRHEWIRTWWDCFGSGKRLHIVLVKSRDELVAIAPFMLTQGRIYRIPVRRLEFIFNAHTPRMDVIVGRAHRDVYRALWKYLDEHHDLWDVVALYQLPEESATLEELQQAARRAGSPTGVWKSEESPYVSLEGRSADDYFAALASKHKSNQRNRTRRLLRAGEVELEIVEGPRGLPEALNRGYEMEAAAWKGAAQSAIRSDEAVQTFYTRMAGLAAQRRWLRLYFLTVDGRRIAFGYALQYAGKLYMLKAGYDPEFAPASPFNVLCEHALRESFREGLREFDFLGEAADWKLKWTTTTRSHHWLFIFSRQPRARFIHWMKFRVANALREEPLVRSLVQWLRGGARRDAPMNMLPSGAETLLAPR
jgi:CelD/BcsL family acetyltransferase involved in cellulose biosynthesis